MFEDRVSAIAAKIEQLNLPMKTVSLRAGHGETFVRDMLKRGRVPSAANLDSVEQAIEELLAERTGAPRTSDARPAHLPLPPRGALPKDVPVMGTAAGSAIGKGAFTIFREPVDYVLRPPGLLAARGIYALYVENDSMAPRFEHGELIYVNEHRPPVIGDYVVIQEPAGSDGDFNAYVKRLVRRSGEWVETSQLNPPATIKFKNSPALRVHKVMTWAELFGV